MEPIDGFWFPQDVREQVLSMDTEYVEQSFARGRPCEAGDDEAVTVRWPVLGSGQWERLVAALRVNRRRAPQGQAFWDRFQAALQLVAGRFIDSSDPLHRLALAALPGYTGYSESMIRVTLGGLSMWTLDQFPAAFNLALTLEAGAGWQLMGDLPGRLRFYSARPWQRLLGRLPATRHRPLLGVGTPLDLVVGYGAGNVPGTALLIAFLAQATTLIGSPPPVTVIRNSRREPIFGPLVLGALEAVDPDLVAAAAVLIWDYQDTAVQEHLLAQADLAIAAAGDEAIAQIARTLGEATGRSAVRLHRHGHKVSFSVIAREMLSHRPCVQADGAPLIDIVTLLAALDSIFWDQHGCLSSRVHFVESDDNGATLAYGTRLAEQLANLALLLPRGNWPRQRLQDRFDRYKLLEQTGLVQVLSHYDDDFVAVLDARPLDASGFQTVVNDCEGRVIVVRPVTDLMEVPDHYLQMLPASNLQSLSIAAGREGEALTDTFLRFADACGARGVTAIRAVGRGAFPQLAYSWDGLIPLDLVSERPEGRFTTIEFEAPHEEVLSTYRLMSTGLPLLASWGIESSGRQT